MRSGGYCPRTESAYLHWVQEFHQYVQSHPPTPTPHGVVQNVPDLTVAQGFLTHLQEERLLSNSALGQAFNALKHFYERLLQQSFLHRDLFPTIHRDPCAPTVLSRREVAKVLEALTPAYQLHARLLYGSGLRLAELLRIQIGDVFLEERHLVVRDYKCETSRTTLIPRSLESSLAEQIQLSRRLWESDQTSYAATVRVARALTNPLPAPPPEWPQSWLFPSTNSRITPHSHNWPRHHQPEDNLQRALRRAAKTQRIPKQVSPEVLRHCFAAHLLESGEDLGTVQELIGHNRAFRDSIYSPFIRRIRQSIHSPLDSLSRGSDEA